MRVGSFNALFGSINNLEKLLKIAFDFNKLAKLIVTPLEPMSYTM